MALPPRDVCAPSVCAKPLTSLRGAAQIPANAIQEAAPQPGGRYKCPNKGLSIPGTDPGHQHRCLAGGETFSRGIWEAREHPRALPPPRPALLTARQKAPASPAWLTRCSATMGQANPPLVHAAVGLQARPPEGHGQSTLGEPEQSPAQARAALPQERRELRGLEPAFIVPLNGPSCPFGCKGVQCSLKAVSPCGLPWVPHHHEWPFTGPRLLSTPSMPWSKSSSCSLQDSAEPWQLDADTFFQAAWTHQGGLGRILAFPQCFWVGLVSTSPARFRLRAMSRLEVPKTEALPSSQPQVVCLHVPATSLSSSLVLDIVHQRWETPCCISSSQAPNLSMLRSQSSF